MTAEPDYIPRECDCGHREHVGACNAKHTYYAPIFVPLPDGAELAPTHKRARDGGLRAYTLRCECESFSEWEGEQP